MAKLYVWHKIGQRKKKKTILSYYLIFIHFIPAPPTSDFIQCDYLSFFSRPLIMIIFAVDDQFQNFLSSWGNTDTPAWSENEIVRANFVRPGKSTEPRHNSFINTPLDKQTPIPTSHVAHKRSGSKSRYPTSIKAIVFRVATFR